MAIHLERHLPIVVVGNNLSSLVLSLTYNAPYVFVENEFPILGKGRLDLFETAKTHRMLFGGALMNMIRMWNKYHMKLPYWDWMTWISGIGGLDITAGNCTEIRFEDPNSLFLMFKDRSTMRIYYDLCFLTSHRKINLKWDLHEKFIKNAKIKVIDGWTSPKLSNEQRPDFPNMIHKTTDPNTDPLVRTLYFPFHKKSYGKWRKYVTYSMMTKEDLDTTATLPITIRNESRRILKENNISRTIKKWGEEHVGRVITYGKTPYYFYPSEDFMFDHNKMVVNWTYDVFIEHLEEMIMSCPEGSIPYWKKFLWILKTRKIRNLKKVER